MSLSTRRATPRGWMTRERRTASSRNGAQGAAMVLWFVEPKRLSCPRGEPQGPLWCLPRDSKASPGCNSHTLAFEARKLTRRMSFNTNLRLGQIFGDISSMMSSRCPAVRTSSKTTGVCPSPDQFPLQLPSSHLASPLPLPCSLFKSFNMARWHPSQSTIS